VENSKVAIITGGASGIGLAISKAFAQNGHTVVIADLNPKQASSQADQLKGDLNHLGIGADVTNEKDVCTLINHVKQKYGRIDALVNNAGIGDSAKATVDQSFDNFQKVLAVHLHGTFLMSREVAKVMISQKIGGAIVNISSISALVGLRKRNAYGAAKAGILSMTRSMASEWACNGIRVNAVAPGYVRTALVEKLIIDGLINEKKINKRTPIGRMAKPEEIAQPVLFLCSDQSSYITGTMLGIDGGWCAFGEAS
jgi:NAD(P)-dependent dehydrogenase (short-subunit alcohol dehydrogenase family)